MIALLAATTGDVLARGTAAAGVAAWPHPRAIHCCMIHLLWPSTAASAEWRVLQGAIATALLLAYICQSGGGANSFKRAHAGPYLASGVPSAKAGKNRRAMPLQGCTQTPK